MSSPDVATAERRLRIVAILRLASFLPLIAAAVVLAMTLPQSGIAPVLLIVAIASRIALTVVAHLLGRRLAHQHYVAAGSSRWWFDPRTGAVEQGERAPGRFRQGPYPSREAAEQAPQIARDRAAAWNAED
jgi:cytochrome P450